MRKPKVRASFRLRAPKTPPARTLVSEAESPDDNAKADGFPVVKGDSAGSSTADGSQPVPAPLSEQGGRKNPQLQATDIRAEPVSELESIIKMVRELNADSGETGAAKEIESSPADESKNARPLKAGVENDATDIGKEQEMQTAAQLKPISDSGISENIDLRDPAPSKGEVVNSDVTALVTNSMASLFGPVIEDDVKGVRNQIRELIQCEMQGELGQRFSRNLRIVIRREIAAAIDDQFDRV